MKTDKQIIDGVDVSGCEKQGETIAGITCGNGERIRFANEIITKHKLCKDNPNCYYKQLKHKEQECEFWQKESDRTHLLMLKRQDELVKEILKNDELEAENKELKKTINKLGIEHENYDNLIYWQMKEQQEKLKSENKELKKRIIKIFACLIEANRTNEITSTLWIDDITTLWDYIAQTLGIEGDQTQIEEQILQLIRKAKEGKRE